MSKFKIFLWTIGVWFLSFVVSVLTAFVEGAILCAAWCVLAQLFNFVEIGYWSAFILMLAINMIVSKFGGNVKVTNNNR